MTTSQRAPYGGATTASGTGGDVGLVVLGCRTSTHRSEAAARAFLADAAQFACVVASGGRAWITEKNGVPMVEADILAKALVDHGIPSHLVVRERCSHSTRENALYSAHILARRGIRKIMLVTSDWHVPRARHHFETHGLDIVGAAPALTSRTLWMRFHTLAHERIAALLDRIVR